ncbi:hypothetical protein AKJ51_03205 [candidate division MSBL1 archaeon SCGC-AAA382A20]|uniref:Uncharacterized protein n=1 Tax=candidate division MSBL1 archaeon SCGC-AAA382A20 TaxID=1698280 RepID=A0A133VJR5_9EURY|nr:hypothetical protein AKJ51_03205 [candidate division MSBL1 archaeon SCGC-AAA382A20]
MNKKFLLVLVLVLPLLVSGCAQQQGARETSKENVTEEKAAGGKEKIPVHPQASEVDVPQKFKQMVPEGVTLRAYDVDASVSDLASWYEDKMSKRGWEKKEGAGYTGKKMSIIVWKKGDRGFGVSIQTKEKQFMEEYAKLFEHNISQTYSGDFTTVKSFLSPES